MMSRMTPFRDEVEEQNYATAKELKFWDKAFPFAGKSLSSDKHYCVCGFPYPSCAIYWVLAGKNFTRHHANVCSIMIHQELCGQQKSDLRDNSQNDLKRVYIYFLIFLLVLSTVFCFRSSRFATGSTASPHVESRDCRIGRETPWSCLEKFDARSCEIKDFMASKKYYPPGK